MTNGRDVLFGLGASWALRRLFYARYARRNVVERCINRLNNGEDWQLTYEWRGLAPHNEKRAVNYRAMVVITSFVIWIDS